MSDRPDPLYRLGDKGVAVHRADCSNFRHMGARSAERLIDVAWGQVAATQPGYAVDVTVQAADRKGLVRDLSEIFAREKMNVTGVQTRSVRDTAWMRFTVEVRGAGQLPKVLDAMARVEGVQSARRR